jgi:hypothetical protein
MKTLQFQFKIDPKTPEKELLPPPPSTESPGGPLLNDDLSTVPEVRFQASEKGLEGMAHTIAKTNHVSDFFLGGLLAARPPNEKGLERMAHTIAKINHLNGKKSDGFLQALLAARPDLAGLPVAMGDACRSKGERNKQFNVAVNTVRRALQQSQSGVVTRTVTRQVLPVITATPTADLVGRTLSSPIGGKKAATKEEEPPPRPLPPSPPPPVGPAASSPAASPAPTADSQAILDGTTQTILEQIVTTPPEGSAGRDAADTFWEQYREARAQEDSTAERRDRSHQKIVALARVAALMQVLAPESPGLRLGLVKYLAGVPYVEATQALAKLALFSAEEEVRHAAIDCLQVRRERDYEEILLQGFRYPLPAVAKRAAEALVQLERKDLIQQLVAVLDEPDPRVPKLQDVNGKKVPVVHELVRLNHHHSCLLCHAPGNTPNVAPETLTAAVPIPGEPLPPSSQGYNTPSIPDILVRLDVTYLRQDFSLLLPVADAHPWPEMQRFDFLVRNRELSEQEAKAFRDKLISREPGFVPPHQRAALAALRELTGRDTEPTAQAWRKLLSLRDPAPPADGAD